MPYYLDNAFLQDNPWITVVGCGGTGGYVAEGLCRLFTGREATIVLVDHDRVEPHNLLRQNFYPKDVGHFKSQASLHRLVASRARIIACKPACVSVRQAVGGCFRWAKYAKLADVEASPDVEM